MTTHSPDGNYFHKGAWKMSIYETYTRVMDMWGFSNPFQVELIQRKITNTVSEVGVL